MSFLERFARPSNANAPNLGEAASLQREILLVLSGRSMRAFARRIDSSHDINASLTRPRLFLTPNPACAL
jgi:hypothetical protein